MLKESYCAERSLDHLIVKSIPLPGYPRIVHQDVNANLLIGEILNEFVNTLVVGYVELKCLDGC